MAGVLDQFIRQINFDERKQSWHPKFALLREQRLIYRLALGQPNQEDLVDFLSKHGSELTDILRPLALDLSSFARQQGESAAERPISSAKQPDGPAAQPILDALQLPISLAKSA